MDRKRAPSEISFSILGDEYCVSFRFVQSLKEVSTPVLGRREGGMIAQKIALSLESLRQLALVSVDAAVL